MAMAIRAFQRILASEPLSRHTQKALHTAMSHQVDICLAKICSPTSSNPRKTMKNPQKFSILLTAHDLFQLISLPTPPSSSPPSAPVDPPQSAARSSARGRAAAAGYRRRRSGPCRGSPAPCPGGRCRRLLAEEGKSSRKRSGNYFALDWCLSLFVVFL